MIYTKLYDWQKKLVDQFKERNSFGIFLDCGLGKTPVSLAFAEVNKCTKILIITINSKAIETKEEEGSWFYWADQSDIDYKLYNKKQEDFFNDENNVLLINYESLFKKQKKEKGKKKQTGINLKENIISFINSCKNHNAAIIVDESHKIKDLQSSQTKAIFQIQSLLKLKSNKVYTYLLTGTPFTSGYEDLYSQLKILGYKENKTYFKDNFCILGNVGGLLGWQQPIVGYKNLDLLYKTIHEYAVTIKADNVVKLPEAIFNYYTTDMSLDFKMFIQEQMNGLKIMDYAKKNKVEIEEEFNVNSTINNPFYANIDYPSEKWLADTSGSFWMRARQLSIGFQGNAEKSIWYDKSRLLKLKKFLQQNEDNYLLFYNYTPELLEIYDICEELGYNIDVYCGECKSLIFYQKYSQQSDQEKLVNKKNIILANFDSGSTGLNWQLYNQCILFSLPLYCDYEQGIKRILRLGQKSDTVIYHIFYQNNWLDKRMLESLQKSINYNDQMFQDDLKQIQLLLD